LELIILTLVSPSIYQVQKENIMSNQQDSSSKGLVTILTALIGVLGTIAVAYFAFRGNTEPKQLEINATQTAETIRATQTAAAPAQSAFDPTKMALEDQATAISLQLTQSASAIQATSISLELTQSATSAQATSISLQLTQSALAQAPVRPVVSIGGYYTIMPKNSNLCLGITSGSTDNGALPVQATCDGSDNQHWNFIPLGDGYYKVMPKNSGMCMGITSGSKDDGALVVQATCDGSDNQQWSLNPSGEYYNVSPRNSGKCLGIAGGSLANGAQVIQWSCLENDNQSWKFISSP
jgi:hypothetical protein